MDRGLPVSLWTFPETVAFLDTETTGLDPDRHEVWEIGLIVGSQEITWAIRPQHLDRADPNALRLIHFYERTEAPGWEWASSYLGSYVAERLAYLTAGKHLAGNVPSFDAAFLERFLRAHGRSPAWHYQLVDVEAIAAGVLGLDPPWDSEDLSSRLGVDPALYERHTALGDARWARDVYGAAMLAPRA